MDTKQKITTHEQLIVWQKSMDLVDRVYTLTRAFPDSERFGLSQQMRRAAVSIPSNIAEGRVRSTTKDFIHFLHMASGSCAELETQLNIARRQRFIDDVTYNDVASLLAEVGKMTVSLISSLNARR